MCEPNSVWFISIMLTRGDVRNFLQALAQQEWSYWNDHPNEWVAHCCSRPTKLVDPAVMWDGYHWHFV